MIRNVLLAAYVIFLIYAMIYHIAWQLAVILLIHFYGTGVHMRQTDKRLEELEADYAAALEAEAARILQEHTDDGGQVH